MNSILDMMEDDASSNSVETVSGEGLKSIADVARRIRETEDEIAKVDTYLKEKKKELLKMTDEDLPSMLQELGVSSFTLDDGSKVDVKPLYGASIPVPRKEEAYKWLRDNGYDDIIKNVVSCSFGRGEDRDAANLIDAAQTLGFHPEQSESVHSSTLRAWVRERVESGDEFPMDLFGAFVGERATIKKGKANG